MNQPAVRSVTLTDRPEWLRMRMQLWADHSAEEHLAEMDEIMATGEDQPVFLVLREDGRAAGFLEGGTRKYADGCDTSPVGYIEGWYVDEDVRFNGYGAALVNAMENWAREKGLREMGSDTWLDNQVSISAHQRLGYVEMERLVHFAKKL